MEELRSTEILDKEIFENARLKAEEILKKADADAQSVLNSLDTKLAEAKKEKEAFYEKKCASYEADLTASVPLEKLRFTSAYKNGEIVRQIDSYIAALSPEKRLELVLCDVVKKTEPVAGKKLNVFVYGFDVKKTQGALSKLLKGSELKVSKTDFGRIVAEDDVGISIKEGVILETEDRQFRGRFTLSQVVSQLLDTHREELARTLFGA